MNFLSRFFGQKRTEEQIQLAKFVVSRFGYTPKNMYYFDCAVTHKSLLNNSHVESNERLEFLGDAIIDAIIAEFLFHRFPHEDEGYLTKIKSKLVSRKTLSEIAEEMEVRRVLRYHKGRTINISTIEGNALEALFGAIYLDGGFESVRKAIEEHVYKKYVNINKVLEEEIDFKSKLFIWCQRNKLSIEFQTVEEVNLGSSWEYKVVTYVNNQKYGMGVGPTKKSAEQIASKETLELIGEI